jgi:hypothetical protein
MGWGLLRKQRLAGTMHICLAAIALSTRCWHAWRLHAYLRRREGPPHPRADLRGAEALQLPPGDG